jgi:hypothetical protein
MLLCDNLQALEIAQTTCNRDIYALVEVPAYGYSNTDSAALANKFASTFYEGSECLCFNTTSCKDPTITITTRGWLPLTPLPVEMGGDGLMYQADSASPAAPWFESMVFPENPSGVIKQTRLPDSNRRVCDGVYVWPMYFGMRVSHSVLSFSTCFVLCVYQCTHFIALDYFWFDRITKFPLTSARTVPHGRSPLPRPILPVSVPASCSTRKIPWSAMMPSPPSWATCTP